MKMLNIWEAPTEGVNLLEVLFLCLDAGGWLYLWEGAAGRMMNLLKGWAF